MCWKVLIIKKSPGNAAVVSSALKSGLISAGQFLIPYTDDGQYPEASGTGETMCLGQSLLTLILQGTCSAGIGN